MRPYVVLRLIVVACSSMLFFAPETWTALGYALVAFLLSRLAVVNIEAAKPMV